MSTKKNEIQLYSHGFSDIALLYFYKEVVLYYEQIIADRPQGFSVKNEQVTGFMHSIGTRFTCVAPSCHIIAPPSFKQKTESFIYFKRWDHMSTLASFLRHLRDSFSHGRFHLIRIEEEDYLCVEDCRKTKNHEVLTMVAQMPYKDFLLLIELIKRIQKKMEM